MNQLHPTSPLFARARRVSRSRIAILIIALAVLATLSMSARAARQDAPLTTFSLGSLNGPNGFRLAGRDAGDGAGRALRNAGDVNGDGLDDFIIGAPAASPNGLQRAGEAYVIFGTVANPTSLPLSSLNGQNGFRLTGAMFNSAAGEAVAGGDVNGDGLADVLIGAPGAGHGEIDATGAVYVVFGASSFPAAIDLGTLDGNRGFRIDGVAEDDRTGAGVGFAGDLNSDGIGDLLIGAPNAVVGGKSAAGRVYVVFGQRILPPQMDLEGMSGSAGFAIDGIAADSNAGQVVGGAGDMNGDGYDDAFIAAPAASRAGAAEAGAVYVLFGKDTFGADLDLGDLAGGHGFRIEGENALDHAGWSVDGGDANGDGRADLLIGAPDAADRNGRAYLVLGSASPPNVLSLATLAGSNGSRLFGSEAHGAAGASVSLADVNGDAHDDIVVGASAAGTGSDRFAGRAYVIFGRPVLEAVIELGSLDAADGLRIDGAAAGDQAGQVISLAGDRDGDGFDEIVIGAPNSGVGVGGRTGAVFLVQGGPTMGIPIPVTHAGTADGDTLTATAGPDVLHGRRGSDLLDGGAASDILKGGQGNDVLLGGADGDALAGGNGRDTVSYVGSPAGVTVDLFTGTATGGHAAGDRFWSIENVTGSSHADSLRGDAVPNILNGGPGDDTLTGDRGDDVYVVGPDSGADTIFGFVPGAGSPDSLDFTALPAIGDSGDLSIAAAGSDTVITLPGGATIRLKNVAPGTLHSDDYRFGGAPLAHPDQYITPTGEPLSVAAPGVLANDENPLTASLMAVLVTNPAHGSVNLKANGSFTYTPQASFIGIDSFTYRASNGQNSNVATVTIAVVQRPPVAVDDSYTVPVGETLTVAAPGVLGNDQNPGGATWTATLVDAPLQGTLALANNGSFTYTPTVDLPALDSFTYRADNGLASNIATVIIAVFEPNGPPLATDDSYNVQAGRNLVVAAPGVLANDVNPSPDALSAVLANGPAHGTLTLAADGSFTYSPQAGFVGTDQFTYRASNGQLSNVAAVRIVVSATGFKVYLPVGVTD